jgi:hypothetical protein
MMRCCHIDAGRFFRDPGMVKQPEAFAVLSGGEQNRHYTMLGSVPFGRRQL